MINIESKVVLISGSSRGIGAGIAKCVKANGGIPIVTFLKNKVAAEKFCAENDMVDLFQMDTTNRASVKEVVGSVVKKYGKLDIVVNNAGILEQKPFMDITEEEWDETLAINLKGAFVMTQEVAKVHRELQQSDMRIVNIASVGGQFGGPKAPHYAASKGALLTFTKSSARIFAEDRITVNAIAPGFIKTEMYEHMLKQQSEKDIVAGIPLGFVGEPQDVGMAVIYLGSEAGRYITGQVININGGSYM